jgi:flagellar protein FliS
MSDTPSTTVDPKPSGAYLRTRILTASPAELRLLLFDGALRFSRMAREGLEAANPERTYEGVTRAQAIIIELINSLRPEHDPVLAARLAGLYTFMYARLIEAHHQRSTAIIDEVIELLEYERQTWTMLMGRLAQENREASAVTGMPAPDAAALAAGASSTATNIIGGTLSVKA